MSRIRNTYGILLIALALPLLGMPGSDPIRGHDVRATTVDAIPLHVLENNNGADNHTTEIRPVAGQQTDHLPDSVTLLMFSGVSLHELSVTSSSALSGGLFVEGMQLQSKQINVKTTSHGLDVNGVARSSVIISADPNSRLVLTSGSFTRSIVGTVLITSSADTLCVVGHLSLHHYLTAALAAESSSNDPVEYRTALAVLQRNFLIMHPHRHAPVADLCDNTHCQAATLKEDSPRLYSIIENAMDVLLVASEDATSFPCYYTGACGGQTLLPSEVWGTQEAGYTTVVCKNCAASKWYQWERTTPVTEPIADILCTTPTPPFVNDDFRIRMGRAIGFNIVLSNTVNAITCTGSTWKFTGKGFGHRIGLCQEGARVLAQRGWHAKDILHYYFPTTRIRRMQHSASSTNARLPSSSSGSSYSIVTHTTR